MVSTGSTTVHHSPPSVEPPVSGGTVVDLQSESVAPVVSPSLQTVPPFVPPALPTLMVAPSPRQARSATPARNIGRTPAASSRQRRRAGAPASNHQQRTTPLLDTSATLPPLPRPQVGSRTGPPRRVKVLPYVPKNLWTLFQDVWRPERASACNNMVEIEHLLKELWEVPAHALSVRRGGRRLESGLATQL